LDAIVQIKSALSAIQAFCTLVGFSISICSTIFVAGAIFVHRKKATLCSSNIIIPIENMSTVVWRNTLNSFDLTENQPNKKKQNKEQPLLMKPKLTWALRCRK
jgi:hypothetical protein